jgi:hypothetical protein
VELYLHLPQYAFRAWCLVKKHKDKFTFTFYLQSLKKPLVNTSVALAGIRTRYLVDTKSPESDSQTFRLRARN